MRLKKNLYQFHLVDILYIAYLFILFFLILFCYARIPYALALLAVHGAGIGAVFCLARLLRNQPPFRASMGRIFFILATLPFLFSELGALVHYVNPHDQELALIEIDFSLFGVHPTLALQSVTTPVLTEYLQIIYSTFYFLPLFLGAFLIAKKRVREMNITLAAVVGGFFLSYFGYFLVPALPPYRVWELHGMLHHTVPLEGLWATDALRETLMVLEKIKRDCFPSGHTELSLVVLCLAYKYEKKAFWVLLPVVTSLIFSTVYLRYHYVIDLIAGAALAVPVVLLTPRIYDWWERKRGNAG